MLVTLQYKLVSNLKKARQSNLSMFIMGSLYIPHVLWRFNVFTLLLLPPPSLSVDCNTAVLQRLIMLLSVDHRALKEEIHPRLLMYMCSWVCVWACEFVYAETRRASVEHWRVMHALSQVDNERECVLHSQSRELGNFMLLCAYSTQPYCNALWSGGKNGALGD